MLFKSFTGMFSNLLAIPLIFRHVSNRFINVLVDFIVFLFLFLSLSRFKSVSVAAAKALVEEVWSVVFPEHVLWHEVSEALATVMSWSR